MRWSTPTLPCLALAFLQPVGLMASHDEAPPASGQDRPPTPEDRYQQLQAEYRAATRAGVMSPEERLQFVGLVYRQRNRLALSLVELAENHPRHPIALQALIEAVWQVNTTPWPVELVGRDQASRRALDLLQRDHLGSDRLGPVCQRLSTGFRQEYEPFLRAALVNSPHDDVRAQACLALGGYLSNRAQRLELIAEQPRQAREFADLFGAHYLQGLQERDPGAAAGEAEALFERAAREHGDLELQDGTTVGQRARAALFGLRNLVVGKQAPDIEGVDQDGEPFKLSDYRGKVVLLDFWSEY